MANANNVEGIENENLFRALVTAPLAIFFVIIAANSVMSSGIFIFKLIFIGMAIYFSLSTLAYAAYYTNDHHAEKADKVFKNKNFFNLLFNAPLSLAFIIFTVLSFTNDASLFFNLIFGALAFISTLFTLAYAAFYTNDCYDSE
ncbi:hypothetical protein Q4493_14275 [Colwellia sp. 1_MG-2023]|uniref:hypothetical protein n=1 Tax=Colwellia sp. 1_MG-2023 TaxID=3062649 RepID=UPI0026E1B9D1|nr:hypothetical protein [Colwellia sp. 1_MG-2023]MDO6446937.1 hypothetical protein [Colwellia sp. 1_MG-2023]